MTKLKLIQLSSYLAIFVLLSLGVSSEFFVLDDYHFIQHNIDIKDFTILKLFKLFSVSLIPIPYFIWGVMGRLFDFESASPFKTLNLTIHLINSLMVGKLILIFLKRQKESIGAKTVQVASFMGSLLFALHPIQAEAIFWPSALKDILSSFFILLTIYFFIRFRDKKLNVLPVITFALLSLLTKPNSISIFPILFAIDYFIFSKKVNRKLLISVLILIIPIVLLHLKRSFPHLDYGQFVIQSIKIIPESLVLFISSLLLYLKNLLLPYPLYFFTYSTKQLSQDFTILHLYIFALIAAGSIILFRSEKISKIIKLSLALFFAIYLPYSGLVTNYFQTNFSLISSRYAYLQIFPLSLLVSYFFLSLPRWRPHLIVILIIFTFITQEQIMTWKSSEKVLLRSAKYSTPNSKLYYLISSFYSGEKKRELAKKWQRKAEALNNNKQD